MASEFETKFLKHSNYWVNCIKIDVLTSTLDISLISNPEIQKVDCRLKFSEITQYYGTYHEYDEFDKFDPNYLQCLLGIFSYKFDNRRKYTITTDAIEISLVAKKEPKIFWIERDPTTNDG